MSGNWWFYFAELYLGRIFSYLAKFAFGAAALSEALEFKLMKNFEICVSSFFDTYLFLSDMFFQGKFYLEQNFLGTFSISGVHFLKSIYFSRPISI